MPAIFLGPCVTYYRLYRLNDAGRIFGVDAGEFETDEQASRHALDLAGAIAGCAAIEIWDRARLAGRVAAPGARGRRP